MLRYAASRGHCSDAYNLYLRSTNDEGRRLSAGLRRSYRIAALSSSRR